MPAKPHVLPGLWLGLRRPVPSPQRQRSRRLEHLPHQHGLLSHPWDSGTTEWRPGLSGERLRGQTRVTSFFIPTSALFSSARTAVALGSRRRPGQGLALREELRRGTQPGRGLFFCNTRPMHSSHQDAFPLALGLGLAGSQHAAPLRCHVPPQARLCQSSGRRAVDNDGSRVVPDRAWRAPGRLWLTSSYSGAKSKLSGGDSCATPRGEAHLCGDWLQCSDGPGSLLSPGIISGVGLTPSCTANRSSCWGTTVLTALQRH